MKVTFHKTLWSWVIRFKNWILSWFEDHKNLYISHNQYNSEGEIIDVLEKKFAVRKFYKCGPKHMKFKKMDGAMVEIKTNLPMDYLLEQIL
jgi:hypothetical protein